MDSRITFTGPSAREEKLEAHARHTGRCLEGHHAWLRAQANALVGVAGMEAGAAVASAALANFEQYFPGVA